MTRDDVIDIIRAEVARAVTAILVGKSNNAEDGLEDIELIYPGAPTIPKRPTMFPYGFRSRARAGATSVTAVQGGHAGNRIIIGHRDEEAIEPEAIGGTVLYDNFGNVLELRDAKPYLAVADGHELHLGAKDLGADKFAAFKDLVKQELEKLAAKIDVNNGLYAAHQHPSGMGPTGTPTNAMQAADEVNDVGSSVVKIA